MTVLPTASAAGALGVASDRAVLEGPVAGERGETPGLGEDEWD